jgi:chorismate dehydratase
MIKHPNIVMVNYLNSKPFEYGLTHSDDVALGNILKATPAKCASLFKEGKADIALIPVGGLADIKDYRIISDYCIACDGEVRTVCIFANQDIQTCRKIYLDDHSRTSFLLSKIILEQYLHLELEYVSADISTIVLAEGEAILMIGDKVFQYEKHYTHKYDLGSIWKKWTNLPFVFAVWIAHSDVPVEIEERLNHALKYGIDHLDIIINQESNENLDLYYYFSHNIHYHLDDDKKEGLQEFLIKVDQYYQVPSKNV